MANRKLKSLKFPGIDDTYILDAGNVNYSDEETYEEGSVGKGLNALKEDINDLPDYGYVPTAGQMMSDNVTVDTEPYSFRATPYGDREIVDGIVGGTVAFNQLVNPNKPSFTFNGVTITNNNDGTFTFNGTANASGADAITYSLPYKQNHKYFISVKGASNDLKFYDGYGADGYDIGGGNIAFWNRESENGYLYFYVTNGVSYNVKVTPQLIDLTLALTPSVADAIYAMEQAHTGDGVAYLKAVAPKMFAQYNAHNSGELMSVSGLSAHETVGKNFFDGSKVTTTSSSNWDVMWSDNVLTVQHKNTYSTGVPRTPVLDLLDGTYTVSFVSSIPSIDVYRNGNYSETLVNGGTFTVNGEETQIGFPNNSATTVTYTNVQIERGSAPTAYEPYQKHSYALDDSLTLMGVPKWDNGLKFDGDVYPPSGGVQSRYDIVDLGTLTWNYNSTYSLFYSQSINNSVAATNDGSPVVCSKYVNQYTGQRIGIAEIEDKAVTLGLKDFSSAVTLVIKDTSYSDAATFKTAMSGVYLVYEKATPTTETAEPYQQIQVCPNGGTEEYISTSIVPVGHSTRYPENSRAKLDGLPWDFSTLIAPTEQEYKATQNYTTGKLLIVNNILYKVTANIANGGNIVPNTNVTATTLSDVIASL